MAVGLCQAPTPLAGAGLGGVGSAEQHGFPFPRLRRGDTDPLFRSESWASGVCERCRCDILHPVQSRKGFSAVRGIGARGPGSARGAPPLCPRRSVER